MASPDNALLIAALTALALLAVLSAVLLYRRQREAGHLRDISERMAAVAATGDFAERLAPHVAGGRAGDLAENVDLLLERLQKESASGVEREHVYRRLTEAMHEGVAVDRDGIQLANARFAELCGAASPAQLNGRQLTDLVHPDFAGLLGEILRRHRAGQAAPERFEAELRSADGPGPRLEFAFQRASYEGRPALLVSAIEMSARAESGSSQRGHGTAWEALDALGEGVATTDAEGRIVYVNQSGEQIIGRPAADALGRSLQEVIYLVDEADRKALGDPVRQCLTTGARVHIGRRGMVVSNDGGGERSGADLRMHAASPVWIKS
jgi:PAS domain S-box-containing protein